jgi:PIN domain nuclease of toxin-antitoxin system
VVKAALESGFSELAVRSSAALAVETLPHYHRDPFDRPLVAQAITEPAVFYTAETQLSPYSDLVRLI